MPCRHRSSGSSAGFSLIELLVVLLIIGLGAGFVAFSVGNNQAYEMRVMAKQFVNHAALMSEEAVLAGQQWGIDLYLDDGGLDQQDELGAERYGYRWLHRENAKWVVTAIEGIEPDTRLAAGIRLELELEGVEETIGLKALPNPDVNDEPLLPDIWLLSSGEITPFVLRFVEQENPDSVHTARSDQLGRIELVKPESENER